MRYVARVVICLVLLGTVPSFSLYAFNRSSALEQQQDKARQVRTYLFKRQYTQAATEIQSVIDRWPDEVLGYFGMMLLYQLRNFENLDHRFDQQYLQWHEQGRKSALKIINDGRSDPWHLFIAAGTLGLSGMYKLNQGKTVRALRDGSMALNALKKALKKDPNWVEPYYGLGLYDYWRSVFTNRWTFLPFFPDKRDEGRRNIQKVIERGTFAQELARGSLAYMYYNDKKYAEALKITGPLVAKYSNNVILQILHAHILTKLKRYDLAKKNYERILRQDPRLTKVNFYLARLYFASAKDEQEKRKKNASASVPVEAYEKVLPWVQRYVEAEPHAKKRWKAEAYSLWGETLYRLKRWSEAKAKFRLALKQDYSLYHAKKRLTELQKRL